MNDKKTNAKTNTEAITGDDFHNLEQKYRDLPRKGWTNKGSRAKANQTIEVNRQEIVEVLSAARMKAIGYDIVFTNMLFYEKMLCALADGEHDAVECDNCLGIYQLGWLDGKCPYCEVDHNNVMVITKKE